MAAFCDLLLCVTKEAVPPLSIVKTWGQVILLTGDAMLEKDAILEAEFVRLGLRGEDF